MRNRCLNILGLPEDANDKDIKRAYRKKAMLYHPDKNHSSNAEEMFIKINEAYEFLTNPEPTHRYRQNSSQREKSPEEKREEDFKKRMERAQKIFKQRQESEQRELLANFKRFKKSIIFRISIPIITFSYALYLLLLIDLSLPSKQVDSYVKSYQKIDAGYDYDLITTKGEYNTHFQEIISPYYAKKGRIIPLNITPILKDAKSAYFLNKNVPNANSTHHYTILMFFCLLFSIPGLAVRRPGLDSYIAIHLGTIVSSLIIIFILSNIY